MTNEQWIEYYNTQIAKLDKEFQEMAQESITGVNQAEIHNKVGANILAEKKYFDQRRYWENKIDELTEVDPSVKAFLEQTQEPSKFDVDSGKTTIDNSLNELEGKAL